MEVANKVAVITGAASGIGAGLAKRFAQEGAAGLVVADLDLDGVRRVADDIGQSAMAIQCDVSREDNIQRLVGAARERFGRVDIYISNAGIPPMPGGFDLEDLYWERMWNIHGMAHVWAARAVLPEMLQRGEGYFLITSSAAGLLSIVESAPYAVSKHAAVATAEWMRIAYGRRGIRVSCLCPQAVHSGMTTNGAGSAGGDAMLTPEQVAEKVVDAMRDERFLVLSHPETHGYWEAKVRDYDRWLGGMQKLYAGYWSDSRMGAAE
ncbi:SDR family oxidoreductase [Rhodococcus opacus]|uniref:SDR family oxidoreductase n=1 Tax=Rhodococcus opacus TaxID=37919 RepID=UPI001C4782EC|nr:SDR family oxidoreductase [Rhodococcus opacus]MBV6756666.1 SDR family oxidoreductase [Rhodococcus opacus]